VVYRVTFSSRDLRKSSGWVETEVMTTICLRVVYYNDTLLFLFPMIAIIKPTFNRNR